MLNARTLSDADRGYYFRSLSPDSDEFKCLPRRELTAQCNHSILKQEDAQRNFAAVAPRVSHDPNAAAQLLFSEDAIVFAYTDPHFPTPVQSQLYETQAPSHSGRGAAPQENQSDQVTRAGTRLKVALLQKFRCFGRKK